jgi:hypothetical protein
MDDKAGAFESSMWVPIGTMLRYDREAGWLLDITAVATLQVASEEEGRRLAQCFTVRQSEKAGGPWIRPATTIMSVAAGAAVWGMLAAVVL